MKKNVDLLKGSIAGSLTRLALPIMGTSLIQMAYNLTDMIWIGKIGSNAVAAVGAAGMYLWLASGLATIPRMGGQVKVGQALGSGKEDRAAEYLSLIHIFISILDLIRRCFWTALRIRKRFVNM